MRVRKVYGKVWKEKKELENDVVIFSKLNDIYFWNSPGSGDDLKGRVLITKFDDPSLFSWALVVDGKKQTLLSQVSFDLICVLRHTQK